MNFRNIINLSRRYFIEGGRKDITTFFIVTLIIAFIGFIQPMGRVSDSFMAFVLFIMSVLYAGRTFSIFQPVSKTIHYLTIPASTAEKTLFNACLVYLYYNALLIAALFLGTTISELIHKLMSSDYNFQLYFPFDWSDLLSLLTLESVFLFGSIYFKTHPVAKTLLSLMVIMIFFFILDTSIFGHYMNSLSPEKMMHLNKSMEEATINHYAYGFCIVVFVFFNFMTWLRLRETEA